MFQLMTATHVSSRSGRLRSRLPLFLLAFSIFLGGTMPAEAASCWRLDGWIGDDPDYPMAGDTADLVSTDCTIVPEGWGWAQVMMSYDGEAPPDLFLQIPNTGPMINGWIGYAWEFSGWLVYSGLDGLGVPEVQLDGHLCTGCPPATELLFPYPPVQAPKFWLLGKRVRLRHAKTNHCLYPVGGNNGLTESKPCAEDPSQTFILDHVGNGQVRLRHESDNQCLYTQDFDNGTVHHSWCSGSMTQRFKLDLTTLMGGGFRLHNVERGQCIYGNPIAGDVIRSWSCWDSQNQVFKIDRLE